MPPRRHDDCRDRQRDAGGGRHFVAFDGRADITFLSLKLISLRARIDRCAKDSALRMRGARRDFMADRFDITKIAGHRA